jgi:hypothetical protein
MDAPSEHAAGIAICLLSATLSNLGLVLIKSVVTAADARIVVKSPGSPPLGDGPGVASGAGAAAARGILHPSRRRSSFMEELKLTEQTAKTVLSSANVTWVVGLLVFVAGQVLNLVSLSFLPEVLWAVVSLFSLVSNTFLSRSILREQVGRREYMSTALILLGSALVVIADGAGSSGSDEGVPGNPWTEEQFVAHFRRPSFLLYCVFITVLLVGSVLRAVRSAGRGHTVEALTWAVISASCSSVSVLLGKCMVEMIKSASAMGALAALLRNASTYVILSIFTLASLMSLVSLNMALAAGEALVVVPWLTTLNTLLAIMGGIFYFEEFGVFQSAPRTLLFVGGVLLAIAGSLLLQRGRVKSAQLLSADDAGLRAPAAPAPRAGRLPPGGLRTPAALEEGKEEEEGSALLAEGSALLPRYSSTTVVEI